MLGFIMSQRVNCIKLYCVAAESHMFFGAWLFAAHFFVI